MPDTKSITANGQSIVFQLGEVTNVALHCSGTFSGANCTFEGSLNGADWFATDAVRSSGNVTASTTGALSAAPAYSWDIACGGYLYLRVRATAFTSGTQVWTASAYDGGVEPAVNAALTAALPAGAANIGIVGTVVPTQSLVNSAATTNATVVKSSGGTIFGIVASNANAAARYLKVYNKATAPTVGTDTPVMVIALPPGATVALPMGTLGARLGTGIGIALTTGIADSDTGAVAAGEIKVAISYV